MSNAIQTYNPTENIVVYHSTDHAVQLDVQLAEDTVWLSQKQMAQLFDTTSQNITLHIGNIYREQELIQSATCKEFLQVQEEGGKEKRRLTKFYNSTVNMADLRCIRQIQYTTVSSYWMTKQYTSLGRHLKMQVRSCSHSRN